MAKLYNQQSVATNKATTAQTSSSFRYKGFSSNETKNNFKLYDIDLVKRDLMNHFYIRKGEKLENPNFGTIIWDMLFENFTSEVRRLITEDVEQIINYDPRVQAVDVTVTSYESGIQIECTLIYLPYNIAESLQLRFDQENGLV